MGIFTDFQADLAFDMYILDTHLETRAHQLWTWTKFMNNPGKGICKISFMYQVDEFGVNVMMQDIPIKYQFDLHKNGMFHRLQGVKSNM